MHTSTRHIGRIGRRRVIPLTPLMPRGIGGVGRVPQPVRERVSGDLFRLAQVGRLRVLPHRPLSMQHCRAEVATIKPRLSGRGHIAGTTKVAGTPDVPAQAKVRLYASHSGEYVGETRSDASGSYQFEHLNPALRYTIIAHDEQGLFRAVVADNLEATA